MTPPRDGYVITSSHIPDGDDVVRARAQVEQREAEGQRLGRLRKRKDPPLDAGVMFTAE